MKEYVMVKPSFNWADEADFEGYLVCTKEYWKNLISEFRKEHPPGSNDIHLQFGSNQSGWYTPEEIEKAYKVKKISFTDYSVVKRLFNGYKDFTIIGEFQDPPD